jgi:hypothetical protein
VTLKDLSTTEEELAQALTVAAAEGFIYRGLVQAPLGGHAVVVLDHDDMEAARSHAEDAPGVPAPAP